MGRVGEGIGGDDLMVREHPLTGPHVPEGVAVPQQLRGERGGDEGAQGEGEHHQPDRRGRREQPALRSDRRAPVQALGVQGGADSG